MAAVLRPPPRPRFSSGTIGKGSGRNRGGNVVWEFSVYFECDSPEPPEGSGIASFEFKMRLPLKVFESPTRFTRMMEKLAEAKMLNIGIPVEAQNWSHRTVGIAYAGRTDAEYPVYRVVNKLEPWAWPHRGWSTIKRWPKKIIGKRKRRKHK
jgi:hypothetical protein